MCSAHTLRRSCVDNGSSDATVGNEDLTLCELIGSLFLEILPSQ